MVLWITNASSASQLTATLDGASSTASQSTAASTGESSSASQSTTASDVTPSTSTQSTAEDPDAYKIRLNVLDLYWFWKLREGNTPLHAGVMSKYIKDPLPLQRICYMDTISRSPTNNDVVRETMIRSMNVAKETGQDYAVVTCDLAVALKAYSINTSTRITFVWQAIDNAWKFPHWAGCLWGSWHTHQRKWNRIHSHRSWSLGWRFHDRIYQGEVL